MDDNISIRKELGRGVWLLASGVVIKASCVTKVLAEKMLSKSAIDRGTEDGDILTYPAENGRASIPLFELGQKGYLDLNSSEIREHFSRLVRLVPDYLSERGLLPAKKTVLVEEKIAAEYKNYIKDFRFVRKKDIIENAVEIATRQKIVDFFKRNDVQSAGAGMLLAESNLLERVREHLQDSDIFSLDDSIKAAVGAISKEALADDYAVKRGLSPFQRELEVAKDAKIKSVDCTLFLADKGPRDFKMNLTDFYNHLDPTVLERFTQHEMRDFPSRDYFGKAGEKIYEQILQKRFCADLVKNCNNYSPETENGYLLAINRTSRVAPKIDGLKELQDRAALREYAENCYKTPSPIVRRIDKFFAEQSEFIGKVKEAAASSESIQKCGVDIAVEEKAEGKILTFTNAEGKKAVFDERFDADMSSYYGMPKDIKECLSAVGLTALAIKEISEDAIFAPIIAAKTVAPVAQIALEAPFPEAENEPTPLPFPENRGEISKSLEKNVATPSANILNNILNQVQETGHGAGISKGR